MNKSGVAQGATFKILCNLIVVFLLFVIVKKYFNCNEFFILFFIFIIDKILKTLNFICVIHNNKTFNRIKDRKLFS